MSANIIEQPLETVLPEAFLGYSKYVILHRAIPDVRDGLKPVHRRIIYAMQELNMRHDKPHSKSARLVGHCMGAYHPHGDSSIYDASVRLAQPWATRYPMVDGHGNFGSIDGDNAAAMRYTEIRMTPFAEIMCQDINKNTVDMIPNYDQRLKEPTVLPSPLPNILLNGTSGIAVGMASNMPPHNLSEVIDGLIAQIEKPSTTSEELMKYVTGPDFPTGGKIVGTDGIKDAYTTGRGKITMRGKVALERGKNGRTLVVITEVPYGVNKANLAAKIESLSVEKVDGITDVRDESDREGMRLVIECHKDCNPQAVLQQLYKYTQLQETFGVINLVINHRGMPAVMTLREINAAYIKHRQTVIRRRTTYELSNAKARAHILEAMVTAINHMDKVIVIIRSAKTPSSAKGQLMVDFGFDDVQAQAILELKLQNLTGLELDSIRAEHQGLLASIADLENILENRSRVDTIIKNDLLSFKNRYGDPRKTTILESDDQGDLVKENKLIHFSADGNFQWTQSKGCIETLAIPDEADELYFLFATKLGQVMRSPVDEFLKARTNEAINLKNDDKLLHVFIVKDSGDIMLVSPIGQGIRFNINQISVQGRKSQGVRGMITDEVVAALYIAPADIDKRLVTYSENGYAKQTLLTEYPVQGRGGKGLAVTKVIPEKTGLIISAVISDGTGKHKKIPVEGRTKIGQCIK
ncbi:MAG: DNA topoisomerase 4 subunit A [Peptococcaceae bacterium]|nr:DNA topoisomerase 4 subunit A [Peptococcaceae bacterium]